MDESPNDPVYCDMAPDYRNGKWMVNFYKTINQWMKKCKERCLWLVLAGHDIEGDGKSELPTYRC